ncbi:MAG: DUF4124 domain-containing protein, partial [Pseudomonadota bacterium]
MSLMVRFLFLVTLNFFSLIINFANADIFKWIDEEGQVNYTNRFPENFQHQEQPGKRLNVNTLESQATGANNARLQMSKERDSVVIQALMRQDKNA